MNPGRQQVGLHAAVPVPCLLFHMHGPLSLPCREACLVVSWQIRPIRLCAAALTLLLRLTCSGSLCKGELQKATLEDEEGDEWQVVGDDASGKGAQPAAAPKDAAAALDKRVRAVCPPFCSVHVAGWSMAAVTLLSTS